MTSITFWEMMYQVMECGMYARLPGWPICIRKHEKLGQLYYFDTASASWLVPYSPSTTDLYETSWEFVRQAEAEKKSVQPETKD